MPVAGVARSQIADSWGDPRDNGLRPHHGTDIMAPGGTLVTAAAPGFVEKLFVSKAGGNTLYVRSPSRRVVYYYAHLSGYAPGVREGLAVKVGDPLGYVGDTGNAGAGNYHLHFGVGLTAPGQRWHEGDRHRSLPVACGETGPALGPRLPNFPAGIPMKINAVEIRPGNILEYEGGIWRAVKIQHTQPGKGGAYMQVEMKNLIDGRKNNVRFRSAESLEKVRLDTVDFQFLFREGDTLTFMDKNNYEQITLDADILGDAAAFLQDGMDVVMELWEERPISVQLPDTIEALIVEADAVVKGQTASSSYKPAILENGVRVMVPPHIGAGTRIVVDVYEQTYVKRAD